MQSQWWLMGFPSVAIADRTWEADGVLSVSYSKAGIVFWGTVGAVQGTLPSQGDTTSCSQWVPSKPYWSYLRNRSLPWARAGDMGLKGNEMLIVTSHTTGSWQNGKLQQHRPSEAHFFLLAHRSPGGNILPYHHQQGGK